MPAESTISTPVPANAKNPPVPSFFAHTAELEFQATLHLLADRARVLTRGTGAAIAVKEKENGEFVYSAIAGESARELGAAANLQNSPLQACIAQKKTIRPRAGANSFDIAAPVLRNQETVAICEFFRGCQFADSDVDAMERIAELVGTAIDHRDAALLAEKIGFEELIEVPGATPSAWHAPRPGEKQTLAPALSEVPAAIEVQKCASCGFPVSTGRKLCVDCEKESDPAIPSVDVFTTPAHESWLGEHGYTIASVLVSLLALAVIFWLRSR